MGLDATPAGATSGVSSQHYTPEAVEGDGNPQKPVVRRPACQPQTAGETSYVPQNNKPTGRTGPRSPKNSGVLTYPMMTRSNSEQMQCFETASDAVKTCEVSAIFCFGDVCFAFNDKDGSGKILMTKDGTTKEADGKQPAGKVESASISPDKKLVMFTTSYDRADPNFNKVLYGDPTKMGSDAALKAAAYTGPTEGMSEPSLREMFMKYLQNNMTTNAGAKIGHFKFEGTAILPNGKTLFAIREMGERYEEGKMEFKVLFLVADYEMKDGELGFTGVSSHMDITEQVWKQLGTKMAGVSSAEYSPTDGKIYFLTTQEEDAGDGIKKLTTHMWSMPFENLGKTETANGSPLFSPVIGEDGNQVQFDHKGEGMAIQESVDECGNPVLEFTITCDDDKQDSVDRGGLNKAPVIKLSVAPEKPALVRADDGE